MLRPIDTQILYQQSQELSNRVQHANQQIGAQQDQFATMMQKQTQINQEKVQKTSENAKVNKDKEKEKENSQRQNKKKIISKSQNKPKAPIQNESTIDIKI
jgi:hypothetical protein